MFPFVTDVISFRVSQEIYKNNPRTNKWVQQGPRTPDHCIKITFPHANKKHAETKIKIRMSFTIAPEEIKYLGMFKI